MKAIGYRQLGGEIVCADCMGTTKPGRYTAKLYTANEVYAHPNRMCSYDRDFARRCVSCGRELPKQVNFSLAVATDFARRINDRPNMLVIDIQFTQRVTDQPEYSVLVEVRGAGDYYRNYRLYNPGDYQEILAIEHSNSLLTIRAQ